MKPSALKGNGILGKKVEYVTGYTQTKASASTLVNTSQAARGGPDGPWGWNEVL